MLLKSRYFPTLIALLSVLLSSTAVGSDNDYRRLPLSQIQKLAQQGDLKAQLEWATALEHGEGIKRDIDFAIVWYCSAAGRARLRRV